MKRVIYHVLLSASLSLSKIGLFFNLPIVSALAMIINFRFLKSKFNNKKKNILVLEKSHGIDDIKQLVKNDYDKNFKFILLSRSHLKVIYDYFSKIKDQEKYKIYVNNVFSYLTKIAKIKLIISFNLMYNTERILQNLDKKLETKYLVCQKECLFNDDVLNNLKKYFKKLEKFKGDHITVYNEQIKSMFVSINYTDGKRISVVGMNRADDYFNLKNQKQEHVLVFLINPETGLINSGNSFRWNKLAEDTINTLLDFAEKNQNVKFFFKAKIISDKESFEQQKLIERRKLKNCKVLYGGNAFNLILNSKLVIAFNSTAIFEALACKKKVLIPYFVNQYRENLEKYIVNTFNSQNIFHAKSKKEIKKFLEDNVCDGKNIEYKDSNEDKKLLDKFIGNSDGNSTKRLRDVIQTLVN